MRARQAAVGSLTVLVLCLLGATSAPASSPTALPRAPITPNGSWTIYHRDNAHTGYDGTVPGATGATAGWSTSHLDAAAYGEPLVYGGLVYAASSNNTVYAINQTSGATVWSRNLGAPQTSGWGCGNVNPTGILGTGVIDATGGRYYVVAFLNSTLSYHLFGLSLTTGATQLNTVVKPAGFDWKIQQERGALALSKDRSHVYVPFGGRAGDCGAYNGWVVGVPTNGAAPNELYKTPSHASGIWASGGVAIEDSTGNALFATGNAIPCVQAASDSVIRTSPTLASPTFFQPNDWNAHWCAPDQDLGSATPVIISPTLAFTTGKYGQGFLINPASLGGTNGQLFPAQSPYVGADVCGGNHSDASFGSFAYASPRVYLECDGFGLVSLTVNTSTPSFSLCTSTCNSAGTWHAGGSMTFGPPIVAGGIVWVVDVNGSGLYGYNASTGAQLFHSAAFGVTHFATPSEAGGQIFVATDSGLKAFNMLLGCRSVAVGISPSSPQPVGTGITVTANASGCPNPNPLYRFWLLAPGASSFQQVQAYSTNNTFNWNPTGVVPGTYRFSVWALDASSTGAFGNASGRWDAYNNSTLFTLTSCASLTVSSQPAPPQGIGTMASVTAQGSTCPSPLYRFLLVPPGAPLQVAQEYSSNAIFNWNTAGLVPGTYRIAVWTRDANSSGKFGNAAGRWDAYNNNTLFTLTTCTSVGVAISPPSPSSSGTIVTVTASAAGCPNPAPLYRFALLAPGSSYQLAQAYSSSATFSWNTTGLPAGSYRFSVWAMDAQSGGASGNSSGRWDVYNNNTVYTIN